MDVVNDLSSDIALAVIEGRLRQKLHVQDAKSFIAAVEAELTRNFLHEDDRDSQETVSTGLSH